MQSPSITPGSSVHSSEFSLANVSTVLATPGQISHTRLNTLQNHKTFRLLDEINKLRTYHPNIALRCADTPPHPHLLVYGECQLGKRAVLEAITEISFPENDVKFPIHIVFNRGQEAKLSVEIIPVDSHPEDEKLRIAKFKKYLDSESFRDLPSLIESADEYIVIDPEGVSGDVLRIVLTDPNGPELSIINLPLSKTAYKDNEYIHKITSDPGTTILAVVTAKGDDTTPKSALRFAREMNPDDTRILGVITLNPDVLECGVERSVIKLAKNEDEYLELGWHVLMNGKERNLNFEDRCLQENSFFETHTWEEVPRSILGISSLRSKLSSLMFGHIKAASSDIYEKGVGALEDCETQLRNMGKRRSTIAEQREFLSTVSDDFGHLCRAALCGVYTDDFFRDGASIERKLKRLRAVIQDLNASFAKEMKSRGHLKQILSDQTEHGSGLQHGGQKGLGFPETITRKEAASWVKTFLFDSRSRNLPGTYSLLIVSELLKEQSKPWEALAQSHLDKTWKVCRKFLQVLFQHIISKTEIVDLVFSHLIDEQMRARFVHASDELKRLLAERSLHVHMITSNNEFLERRNAILSKKIEKDCKLAIQASEPFGWANGPVTLEPDKFCATLTSLISEDLGYNIDNGNDYDGILDEMSAFYQVSLNVFIHNVTVQVIERHLLDKLWEILSQSTVARIPESLVADIAAESIDDRYQRNRLEVRKNGLQTSLEACRDALCGSRSTYITVGKPQNYFTSFIGSEDLASLLEDLPTQDVTALENPSGVEPVGTGISATPNDVSKGVKFAGETSQSPIVPGGANLAAAGTKPAINPGGGLFTSASSTASSSNPNQTSSIGTKPAINPNGGLFTSTSSPAPSSNPNQTSSIFTKPAINTNGGLFTSTSSPAPSSNPNQTSSIFTKPAINTNGGLFTSTSSPAPSGNPNQAASIGSSASRNTSTSPIAPGFSKPSKPSTDCIVTNKS
ncbi:uncharacterized protein LAJ45_00598 [Morchella importuna]|uniref:uncharacterized protein n=1 Tax=Morchella importuna TaxID=1174673 RepID=UPI001E8CEDCC|nr:uncharacterized protein LAJ45_00598 [Morchella importuna]KAH8155588.1 hypothetical protein LAJ45_00598 [Morchella importuna]